VCFRRWRGCRGKFLLRAGAKPSPIRKIRIDKAAIPRQGRCFTRGVCLQSLSIGPAFSGEAVAA